MEEYFKWAEGLRLSFIETDVDDLTPMLEMQGEGGVRKDGPGSKSS